MNWTGSLVVFLQLIEVDNCTTNPESDLKLIIEMHTHSQVLYILKRGGFKNQ